MLYAIFLKNDSLQNTDGSSFLFHSTKCKCNLHAIKLTNGCTCGNLSRSSTLFLYNVTRTE